MTIDTTVKTPTPEEVAAKKAADAEVAAANTKAAAERKAAAEYAAKTILTKEDLANLKFVSVEFISDPLIDALVLTTDVSPTTIINLAQLTKLVTVTASSNEVEVAKADYRVVR
jgi:hypothetical protein